MSYQLQVLCALVRLSRRSTNLSNDALVARAGGSITTVAAALRSLESLGLLTLNNGTPRLTLDGLALGQASSSVMASASSSGSVESVRAPRAERRSASRRMSGAATGSSRTSRTPARRAA